MGVLFDVNVLLALGWSNHLFHQQVLRWFETHAGDEWWTCSLTESAFIRLSSNPKAVTAALSPADARERLRQMLNHPLHRFAASTPSPLESVFDEQMQLSSKAEHVTDAYLIGLAKHHGLRFLTADTRLRRLVGTYSGIEFLI